MMVAAAWVIIGLVFLTNGNPILGFVITALGVLGIIMPLVRQGPPPK